MPTSTDAQPDQRSTASDQMFAAIQWLLPTRLLSHAMHLIAGSRRSWLKRLLIAVFRRLYQIDLDEAVVTNAGDYPSFNAFFTRALRAEARPLPEDPDLLASPVDGCLGACGHIAGGQMVQAKGALYTVADLLRSESAAAPFLGGNYVTIYLAPHNYHRIHMPIAGSLRQTHYLPGRLFGVNPSSVRAIPRLFTRNERLACLFDTAVGPMALVMVSAFCVGGIETVWSGPQTPPHWRGPHTQTFPSSDGAQPRLTRGAELGRFNLGSTVILLFGSGALQWADQVRTGTAVRMGEPLARLTFGV